MAFTVVDSGEVLLLRYILNNLTPGDTRLHLFSNNVTPSESQDINSYTECSVSGYTTHVLGGTGWTFATSAGTSTATYARQTFTFSTSATVYGYYLTNTDGSGQALIASEAFDGAPFNVPSGGGTIDVDPLIGLN